MRKRKTNKQILEQRIQKREITRIQRFREKRKEMEKIKNDR